MAKLYVDTIEPEGATTNLAIGESGQDVILPGNDIRANVLQDAGGNAILTSNGSGTLSGVNSAFGDGLKLLSTNTVSDGAAAEFTSGLTSAYNEYIFTFINVNPATDNEYFVFQTSTNGGSSYGLNCVTTYCYAYHDVADTAQGMTFHAANSADNVDTNIILAHSVGGGASEGLSGEMHFFNPSSATLVKNFWCRIQMYEQSNYSEDVYIGGYYNTASDIDAIKFYFSSGNMDGIVKMYGVA